MQSIVLAHMHYLSGIFAYAQMQMGID